MSVLVTEPGRPGAYRCIPPGMVGQENDPAGAHPVAQQVVQGEVLQLVGTYLRLSGLDLLAGTSGDELGGDFCSQHRLEHHIRASLNWPDEMHHRMRC